MKFDPTAGTDFYKIGHKDQYPKGTEMVYSNMTARSNGHAKMLHDVQPEKKEDNYVVNFGLQYVIKHLLIDEWNKNFFEKPLEEVLAKYQRRIKNTLGVEDTGEHFAQLHKLGYLPILIKALPEGAKVPIGVPLFTIKNTMSEYFWLTNFLETSLSAMAWLPITSATTAYQYRQLFDYYAEKTGGDTGFVDFQGHDFSFRGMSSLQAAAVSGMAHLLSFKGTDTIPAIDMVEDYYDGNIETGLIGASVPATEHSVQCMGTQEGEIDTFRRLFNEIYPSGIVSIVSDTWDWWKVVTEYMPTLKDEIVARDGKVVIRPDSGDPVKIIVGDPDARFDSAEYKGAIECLWDTFGGTYTENNYKLLDQHIGLIYGDSITLERAYQIMEGLSKKGFASTNVVLGIGSYTYQHVTRDTHGFAIKSTAGKVNGELREIFKDPKTDSGLKKSAKGLLRVGYENGKYVLYDQQTEEQELRGELKVVFANGILMKEEPFEDIRERLKEQ